MMLDSQINLQELIERIKPLAEMFPRVYPDWQITFINAYVCSEVNPSASFSTDTRADVQNFKAFLKPRVHRLNILDIGGGPSMPGYLEGLLCTTVLVDPLLNTGLAEQLRQDDKSFDACIFATSIDHFCDVQTALKEAKRVLKDHGRIFIWSNKWRPPKHKKAEIDGVWYIAPRTADNPFHYKCLGFKELHKRLRKLDFKLITKHTPHHHQCFQEYKKC